MDNVCHTLVGLAMGEAGLKKKSTLAAATLMIGANLPDVDGALYFFGDPITALGFRRGWTHGILAMAVWPFVLTAIMLGVEALLHRWRPTRQRADARGLLTLSALSIWSHPLLDLMNTYGVRLLMPFSTHWYHGDTLFIVDLWILLALVAGITQARRAQRNGSPHPFRPARVALTAVVSYIGLMFVIGRVSGRLVRADLEHEGFAVRRLMSAPVPLNPLRRQIVAEVADGYTTAEVDWFTAKSPDGTRVWKAGAFVFEGGEQWERNDTLPEARAAAATREGRIFLAWARFPFFDIGGADNGSCGVGFVCIRDMRYYPQGWAEVAVPVAGTLSSPTVPRSPEQP